MRRTVFTGRRGLAPVLLTVVIVWALAAVLMLTGTLLAARSIKKDVAVINPEVSDITTDTGFIEIALKVVNVSDDIAKSVKPLDQELQDTLAAAKTIDKTAKSILKKAGPINDVVKSINGNVTQINGTVNQISGNARAILSNASAINSNAREINQSALGINSTAIGVNGDVRSIRQRAGGILETARDAEREVAGINTRAEGARRVAIPIKADLDAVLGLVGSINSNANGIDCSNAIMGSACTQSRSGPRIPSTRRGLARLFSIRLPEKPLPKAPKDPNVPVKAPKVRKPVKPPKQQTAAPNQDRPNAVRDATKPVRGVVDTIRANVDKATGVIPGLKRGANSIICANLILRSVCKQ